MAKASTTAKGAVKKSRSEFFGGVTVKEGQTVTIRQARSFIGRDEQFRDTLRALGLGRIGKSRTVTASPAVLGMMRRVATVLSVESGK